MRDISRIASLSYLESLSSKSAQMSNAERRETGQGDTVVVPGSQVVQPALVTTVQLFVSVFFLHFRPSQVCPGGPSVSPLPPSPAGNYRPRLPCQQKLAFFSGIFAYSSAGDSNICTIDFTRGTDRTNQT